MYSCLSLSNIYILYYSRYVGAFLDILAISCDSFDESTNADIGRHQGSRNHLASLVTVRQWCRDYQVAFKINTVVNSHNWEEDMSQQILELDPIRWKVRPLVYFIVFHKNNFCIVSISFRSS